MTQGVPIDITGKRFGRIKVLRFDGYFDRGPHQAWLVRCDCGREWRCRSQPLRLGQRQCRECAIRERVVVGKTELSIRLSTGETIAQVAERAGLTTDAVYHRWLRGWPEHELGLPSRKTGKRGKGLGGSTYVEDRRRTLLPAPPPRRVA